MRRRGIGWILLMLIAVIAYSCAESRWRSELVARCLIGRGYRKI